MSSTSPIGIERDAATLRLTLDAPPVNVISIAMLEILEREIRRADEDPAIRLIVIDANGKLFSAGVDVADHVGDLVAKMMDALERLFVTMDRCETIVVALAKGAAIGGGCELCLGADLCYAAESAKFGQPEIKLGLMAPPASVLLPRRIGEAKALDMLLTGRTISARDAELAGMIAGCYPDDRFEEETSKTLKILLSYSASALSHAKQAVRLSRDGELSETHNRVNRFYMDSLMKTADAHEGLAAFLEKRPASWKHRD